MVEYTPGPWNAEFGEAVYVLDRERDRVCTINWLRGSFNRRPDKEGEANARLIAAAPKLLKALQDLVEAKAGHLNSTEDIWLQASAALAEATQRS